MDRYFGESLSSRPSPGSSHEKHRDDIFRQIDLNSTEPRIGGVHMDNLIYPASVYKPYVAAEVLNQVSQQMMTLLGRQLDKSKLAAGLPGDAMFYHKSGWWNYWTNDIGIVDDGHIRFVIAAFLPIRQEDALPKFRELAEEVFRLMESRTESE